MKRILSSFAAAACLLSCIQESIVEEQIMQNPEPPVETTQERVIHLSAQISNEQEIDTKSILDQSGIETKLTGITVAAYDKGGVIRDCRHYTNGFSSMELCVAADMTYNIYALANMGDMTSLMPASESALPELSWQLDSYSEIASNGFPMCGKLENLKNEGGRICLDRLFAKFSVRILHTGLPSTSAQEIFSYNMCNKSIYLRQANTRLFPFSSHGSRALSDSDTANLSDYNPDLNNSSAYKGSLKPSQMGPGPGYFKDTTLVFYVPENMQGQLLPGNTDPYRKVPQNISSLDKDYSGLCTYLEFNAERKNNGNGYSGGVTYRYYLGADSTTDFNIERNCKYNMTLDFTENGFFIQSWKVERHEDWSDKRTLEFVGGPFTISQGQSKKVMVHYNTNGGNNSTLRPDDWTCMFDQAGMKAAGLEYSVNKSSLVTGENGNEDFCITFTAASNASVGTSFPLKIVSWDGSLTDNSTISITKASSISISWDICPSYVSQQGIMTVSGISSENLPVTLSGYDSNILSVTRLSDNQFRIVGLDAGQTTVKVSGSEGESKIELDMNIQAPVLRLGVGSIAVNPDGAEVSCEYEYLDNSMSPISGINQDVFAEKLMPKASNLPGWFSATASASDVKFRIEKLLDGTESIVPGQTYGITLGASGCNSVIGRNLSLHVTDPFSDIVKISDFGKIHDYSLFLSGTCSYPSVRNCFTELINQNSSFEYEAPVPHADLSQVSAELSPAWSDFSFTCESFGLSWGSSDSFSTGASFKIARKSVTSSTKHSAGKHNVILNVTNRHSGEKLSKVCGTVGIYVHTAVGSEAVIGSRAATHTNGTYYGSFADIYNTLCGNKLFSDSDDYIYYADVTVKFLTTVTGVYVYKGMQDGVNTRHDRFDCFDIVRPSVTDGQKGNGLLYSVFDDKGGDRIVVCGEPYGYRRGIGKLLYRAIIMNGYSTPISTIQQEQLLLGYNPSGTEHNKSYAPKYKVHDMNIGSNMSTNIVSTNSPYYFSPSSCSSYRDSQDNGYHVIHFLESLLPASCGWLNFL
ncbi:MAG: hypothetical protein ACI4TU_02075 [Candidatus Cryptobacteroides sp.]